MPLILYFSHLTPLAFRSPLASSRSPTHLVSVLSASCCPSLLQYHPRHHSFSLLLLSLSPFVRCWHACIHHACRACLLTTADRCSSYLVLFVLRCDGFRPCLFLPLIISHHLYTVVSYAGIRGPEVAALSSVWFVLRLVSPRSLLFSLEISLCRQSHRILQSRNLGRDCVFVATPFRVRAECTHVHNVSICYLSNADRLLVPHFVLLVCMFAYTERHFPLS